MPGLQAFCLGVGSRFRAPNIRHESCQFRALSLRPLPLPEQLPPSLKPSTSRLPSDRHCVRRKAQLFSGGWKAPHRHAFSEFRV